MATYTIKYALNSGSGSFPDQTANVGSDITLHPSTPTRTNFTFVRWDSSTGSIYAPGRTFTENKSVTLTAAWTSTPAGFVPVTSVQINNKTLNMTQGETKQCTYTVLPSNATDKTVIWTPRSDINNVLNVSTTGVITAKAVGSATVTLRSNANDSRTDSFSVNVTPPPMKIYISPANHQKPYTGYTINEWNEKKNMELVGDYLKSFLNNYKVDIYLDKTDRSGGQETYVGRPDEANKWITNKNRGLYLALHSNAGANGGTTARGTLGIYNSIREAKSLAEAFVEAIVPILPTGSNRATPTYKADNTSGSLQNLGELREPYNYDIPSVLIETAFHDNPNEVAFLITKQQKLAETIGNVLVNFYNIEHK